MSFRPAFRSRRVVCLFGLTLLSAVAAFARAPNILLILADDLGYSDPGCYGGEIPTPNLDRLAREGVRLPRFYNCGMCVVSRTSMLTGQWWPRGQPAFRQVTLLPEYLKRAGYRTGLIGKWHLPGHPLDRGFDHFFGYLGGFSDYFAGTKDYQLDRQPFTEFPADYYSTDAFTDRAIAFINRPAAAGNPPDQPFFLYLSFQAPHNPLQAPPADIARHRGKYLGGWQAIREARFARQKQLQLVPADATLPAYPENLPAWNSLTAAQRDLEDLRMATYAAMVERMDAGIGRVLAALEAKGELGQTLILFMSDNGSDSFSVLDALWLKREKLPGDPGSNYQPGTGWAYANVTPWRLYKISQHAGGVTSGAIAWWPGHTGAPGRIAPSSVHMIDVLPTLLAAAAPTEKLAPAPGESFLPLLQGADWHRTGPLYFQYMDNRAIRTADWTLAEVDGAAWELFDAKSDPFEGHDVAAQHRETVAALAEQWGGWWRRESGSPDYVPKSTKSDRNYKPQGDRGSGVPYVPSSMPPALADRHPLPAAPAPR